MAVSGIANRSQGRSAGPTLGSHQQEVEILVADKTLKASDSGKTFFLDAVDLDIILPSTVGGLYFTFIVATISGGAGATISPAALDAIHGAGLTSVDDKHLINTGATDEEGDMVTIVADGVDGWFITDFIGIWIKES